MLTLKFDSNNYNIQLLSFPDIFNKHNNSYDIEYNEKGNIYNRNCIIHYDILIYIGNYDKQNNKFIVYNGEVEDLYKEPNHSTIVVFRRKEDKKCKELMKNLNELESYKSPSDIGGIFPKYKIIEVLIRETENKIENHLNERLNKNINIFKEIINKYIPECEIIDKTDEPSDKFLIISNTSKLINYKGINIYI